MSELQIAKIDVFKVELPYSEGVYYLSGGREYRSFDTTIVRITTNTGIEGWGESTPFVSNYIASHALGVRAGVAEIATWLIGLDPSRVDRINEAMDSTLISHEHAKTPIDIACWNIFGKSVGMPVCELLGGRTDVEHRARGYIGHSVKIGGDPGEDARRITASLADMQPGEFFLVDANDGMTVENALRMLRLLPPGLDFVLEAPCATWREIVSLRRRRNVPIHFDELATTDASIIQMVVDDAAEGFGIKISKNGSLTKSRRHRDIALAAGYTMSCQETTGSDIAFAAIIHLGQTIPERNLRCILECRDMLL
ncbi:hypothetical protein J7337_007175 [Fusarium musae]|uniref:Mandelate racemase/muconate lactonizing enzyme C-terminal domain-containing protein n=1 Tax=Fusarium musae TaxID=1042133 RepID=A0A9P8IQ15_9HYPO|nr:hypothetical protein J7337_007175 [Fusarium musae]KAG9501487.1 hypothetical protein J7337_007175 [Fusarium musae]